MSDETNPPDLAASPHAYRWVVTQVSTATLFLAPKSSGNPVTPCIVLGQKTRSKQVSKPVTPCIHLAHLETR